MLGKLFKSLVFLGILAVAFAAGMNCADAQAQAPEEPPPRVEVTHLRTQHTKTYQIGNHFEMVIGRNLHYQDADGLWKDVDLTFHQVAGMEHHNGVHVLSNGDEYHMGAALATTRVTRRTVEVINPETGTGIRWALPSDARMEPNAPLEEDRAKVAAVDNGVVWEFHTTSSGLKALGFVSTAQGIQTHTFPYQLIGTDTPLQIQGGRLVGDGFILLPVVVIDALGNRYPLEYTLSPNSVSFTFDDSVIPMGGYPYVIDPTVDFDVDSSDDDGYIQKQGTAYPPSGDAGTTVNITGNTINMQKTTGFTTTTGVIAWDTSALPEDATVTAATLTVNVTSLTDTDNRQLLADWYAGVPPITATDFDETGDGAAGGFPLAAISMGAGQMFSLNTAEHTINSNGMTSLRLTISGGEPTGNNEVQIESFDDAGTDEPTLTITYTTPLEQTQPSIGDVTAYRNILQENDFLLIVPYNISFVTLPQELASQEYRSRLLDGSIILQSTRPVSTSENGLAGYGDGFMSYYFSASQFQAANGEWNVPGKYTITLEAINGPQTTSTTDIQYREGGREDLLEDLRTLAQFLETRWGIDIISNGRLTVIGQDYFQAVMPLIQQMLPEFVNISVNRPPLEPITVDPSGTANLSFDEFWDGTDFKAGVEALGDMWGLSGTEAATAIALGLGLLACVIMVLKKANPAIGVTGFGITIILAANVGLSPFALALVLGFIGLLGIAYIFAMRSASA